MIVLVRLAVFITLLFALALLVSASAAYVDPRICWVPHLMGLLYPVLLAANLLLLLGWVLLRRRYALIPLAAMVFTWPVLRTFVAVRTRAPAVAADSGLHVMSYNVRNFDLYRWNGGDTTLGRMVDLIRAEQPDVACFQEFFNADTGRFTTVRRLLNEAGFKHYKFHKSVIRKGYGSWGIATFSRYPIVHSKSALLPGSEYNAYLVTDIRVGTDTIRIINTHLRSVYLSQSDLEYIDEVAASRDVQVQPARRITGKIKRASVDRAPQADALSQAITASTVPVIVCGDFNDTPCSYTYRTVSGSLQDAFLKAGSGFESTYSEFRFPLRLDYIFTDTRFTVSEYRCIQHTYSDHYPVTCRIRLPKTPPLF